MAKNPVQFQKGFSLPQFLKQYGTELQCHNALFNWRWPSGFICPDCGHVGYCEIGGRGVYQCHRCHRQTSVTSGTIFEYTKLPLTTWFLGMYILTQTKNGVSALEMKRQLGISYNAAWRMKHKLLQVMKERDDGKPLSGTIQVDDAYWGGERSGGKRGRGAPGKTPFVAAVQTNEDGHVKNSMHGSYYSINGRHLPRYLAEFCYRFNRRYKLGDMIPRLGYIAVRTPPMPQRLLSMAEAWG